MKSVRSLWNKKNVDKLLDMKEIGHRSYAEIARTIGCSVTKAKEKYRALVR